MEEQKEETVKTENVKHKKRKMDKTQLAIKIVASVLAIVFVGSMFTTAVFYIFG